MGRNIYYYVNFDWNHIYSIPFVCARETALQSFQYKIINRFLPCKEALKLWKKEETDHCTTCSMVDTIEHYLYECNVVKHFWQMFFYLVVYGTRLRG